jgi:rod shape-determining protein MreD
LQSIYKLFRKIVPLASIYLLVIFSVLPRGLSNVPDIFPMLTLIAIFYWATYRPDLTPPILMFLIGLTQDIFIGTTIGLMAAVFLGVYGITLTQRKTLIRKTFYVIWFGFTVISAIAFTSIWTLSGLLSGSYVVSIAPLVQYVLTVLSFPVVIWCFVRIQRYLVD